MALIKRVIVSCNKCGAESNGDYTSQLVNVLGEEYYLCDECTLRLLNWLSTTTESCEVVQEVSTKPEPTQTSTSTLSPIVGSNDRRSSYFRWDDLANDKLVEMVNGGYNHTQIANEFRLSVASVSSQIFKIRHAKPGDQYHPWKRKIKGGDN